MRTLIEKPVVMFLRLLLAVALTTSALGIQPAAAAENWITKSVTFTACSASATSSTVTLFTGTTQFTVARVVMIRDVDFAGGAVSAYTIEVGKSGATTKYQAATDVFTGVSNGIANAIVSTGPGVEAAGVDLIATCRSTSANLSAATAGRVTFKILVGTI